MEFTFRTLTPLWCGGVDRSSDFIKESGLIGSLRFWFDGLLRAQGARVCRSRDGAPGSRSCEVSTGRMEEVNALCESCRVFGCTGWARRFRLGVEGLKTVPVFFQASPDVARATGNWLWNVFGGDKYGGKKIPQGRDWRYVFGAQAMWSVNPFRVSIEMHPDAEEGVEERLWATLARIQEVGGWGAKTQYGYGQIGAEGGGLDEVAEKGRNYFASVANGDSVTGEDFVLTPNRFFHVRHEFKRLPGVLETIGDPPVDFHNEYIPCSFDIRYKFRMSYDGRGDDRGLRPDAAYEFGPEIAEDWFGYVRRGEDARASRVHVSHLFRSGQGYAVKVWGDLVPGVTREEAEDLVKTTLNDWQGSFQR